MKKTKLFLLTLMLLTGIFTGAKAAEVKEMERQILNFNTGWLYYKGDCVNGNALMLNDSGFEQVSLPHANTVLSKHKGPDFQSQIESYRFVSWYRRHFTLPSEYSSNTSVIVDFQGVATVADVYVNGKYIGSHRGAYTGFSFDIAPYLINGDNVIAVRVDSTRQSDIPPEGKNVDYCLFGGIVRDVNMIITSPLHLENSFLYTSALTAEKGIVAGEMTVINSFDEEKQVKFETVIYDAEGNETAKIQSDCITVEPSTSAVLKAQSGEILNPHLWDVDDPYLYTAVTSIICGETTVDTFFEKIGMRFFEFKSGADDASFYLNGKKLILLGINRHEQWPWQGRAIPNKLQKRDADMIKETGFNAVRCSHYPQDPEFLSRCDELGLIVFEEAPGWQHIGNDMWKETYKENIREMIIRDRNHPSIVTWGVRVNESNDDDALYTETNKIARELDPTRPTHGARRQDTYSYSTFLEDIFTAHYIYPENPVHTPFIITEHSWDCWTNGYGCPWATDEQALAFTKDFADKVNYYYGNNLCAGGFAWSMFDYDNEVNYTNTNNVFYSGMYDIFRLPKPAANLYISQKDPKKYGANIYISNYWDDDAKPLTVQQVSGDIAQGDSATGGVIEGDSFSVTVMSNCDTVELYINGVKVDKEPVRQYLNLPHPFFVFEGIEYEAGKVEAVGYMDGKEAVRTVQRTPEKGAKLVLTPDYTVLTADGSDMTSVSIELVDKNGTRLPYADNIVTISTEGNADFIGEETIALEGGRTAFLVRTRRGETGTVRFTASADGIESGECEITIDPFAEENIVPYSESGGTITPLLVKEVNDTDSSFGYSGNWIYCAQNGAFNADNHYSEKVGDTVTVTFEGEMLRWYGTKAPAHGIMAVSVDGGEEALIDCYSGVRTDNILLYSTPALNSGVHTVTVRVTGEKNPAATNAYVNADRVQIFERAASIENIFIKNGAVFEGNGYVLEDGILIQPSANFGDHTTILENAPSDFSIEAYVPVPTVNDTGCSVMGRIDDESHFYQLELKRDGESLIWAIWKSDGYNWSSLSSGRIETDRETVGLRFSAVGNVLSAAYNLGDEWIAVGSCSDSAYSRGGVGLRTHNMSGKFTDVFAAELTSSDSSKAVIREINIKNGEIAEVKISCGEENTQVIYAVYNDGEIADIKSFPVIDSTAALDSAALDNSGKLFLWSGNGDIEPLGLVCEF